MKPVVINKFNSGITNDPRDPNHVARVITNFDALTNAYKLTPYRDSESGDSAASTSQKQNFAIALRTGSTYSLYALGVQSAQPTRAEIMYKDFTALDSATWSTPSNNQSSGGSTSFGLFTYYAKTGLIYGAKSGTTIWAFSPSGGAFNETAASVTYTNISDGIVHSKDDIMYFGADNTIVKNDNGSFSTALTLPTNFYVSSICEYGNFLAIAAAPLSGVGKSRVYLWDRDTSLTTLSENIDWGEGPLKIINEVEGALVGISLYGNNLTRLADRVVFKYYDSSRGAITFEELQGATSTQLLSAKQKIDQRLLFMMSISLNGAVREGVWSVGRDASGRFGVVHERTPNNDTALSSGVLKGFIKVGDYLFQSFTDSGTYTLMKTNDQASYTATSIIETTINPGMAADDRIQLKQLMSVGAMYEALPAAGQIVVKYKVDGGSYTTVFTETTDGVVYTEPYTLTAAGSQFTRGKEYEFRVESTGGAEVTGLHYRFERIASKV